MTLSIILGACNSDENKNDIILNKVNLMNNWETAYKFNR